MAQNKLKLADVASSTGTGDFVFATSPTIITPILSGISTSIIDDAGTNTQVYPLVLSHTTSGTAANNLGVGFLFNLENAAGATQPAGFVRALWTDATNSLGAVQLGVPFAAGMTAAYVQLLPNVWSPVSSDGAALGSTSLMWSDLFLASGGVINWNNGDVTLTHGSNVLTLAGGDLALGANNLTTTGSIGATGARATKVWATDIESTNAPTVGGTAVLVSGGALGTPSSGTVTNLTGTASININGTVGATTPTTGVFTTLVAGSTTSLLLGTAGSAVGNIGFRNATSGTITLAPVTGALGTVTLTLPAITDTLAALTATQTFTNKTLQGAAITGALTGTGAYIPVTLLNSGTSASSSTFWRGDGTWAAPSGGGSYSYKTGGTSTGANNISITSLDLDTDTKYKIFVKFYIASLSSGTDIEMTFNTDAASGNYGYAFNGYGRDSDTNAVYVGAGESVNGIKLCDAFGMGSFELTVWQETDGANESKIVMGNGWLSRPFNTGQARETTTVNNSGNWQDNTNVTSIQFDIVGTANTANWEYRVYKIVNS